MSMKKVFSLVICAIILFSIPAFASAEDALPESAHNYEDNTDQIWSYSLDSAPYGLYITFSEETSFEPEDYSSGKFGDTLDVYTQTGDFFKTFTGDELAGAEVYVPDKSFRLRFKSDESVNAYGFKVTSVRAAEKDEVYSVLCHPCLDGEDDFSLTFSKRDTAVSEYYSYAGSEFPSYYRDGYSLAGWADEPDGTVCCENTETPSKDTTELWAVWVRLLLDQNEIFSFMNYEGDLCVDGKKNYYLTSRDYMMIQHNYYRTFGIAPYPTPIVSAVYATFPAWKWKGSCYGMAAVAALQHYGYIDVLPMQNVNSLSEMAPDKELISLINYYQAQQAATWPTYNKMYVSGTPLYKEQMKNLYKSVESGKIVLIGVGSLDHALLLTGAYTKADGEHILMAYDSNIPTIYGSLTSAFVISSDWTDVTYRGEKIKQIGWTDDFSQFESLDISGKGPVISWHRAFFRHLENVFITIWQIITGIF